MFTYTPMCRLNTDNLGVLLVQSSIITQEKRYKQFDVFTICERGIRLKLLLTI
jgi:hypothetical protein